MASVFDSVPVQKHPRTTFNHGHKNTISMPLGKLIPVDCFEAYPGDSFRIRPQLMSRLMAMNAPLLDQVDIHLDYFKVPVRLLYKDFEQFITGGVDGDFAGTIPFMDLAQKYKHDVTVDAPHAHAHFGPGSLLDYLGYPSPIRYNPDGSYAFVDKDDISSDVHVKASLLALNAYHCVVNNFYRDQNLESEVPLLDESGQQTPTTAHLLLRSRCWKKDYFTSALQDPQRGNSVGISLGTSAPVIVDSFDSSDPEIEGERVLLASSSHASPRVFTSSDGETFSFTGEADLRGASAISILALRTAFAVQKLLEGNNVAGGRYKENTAFNFGIFNGDARLQRPECIGRSRLPIMVSPVDVTADAGNLVAGDQAGKAKASGTFGTFRTFCSEHCIIIGIASIMPKPQYCQGLSRFLGDRFDRYDWFWPALERIGEQAIKGREVYCAYDNNGAKGNDSDFGYQMRFGDLKYRPDEIHGDMKTSLSFWHTARLFTNRPVLNADFVHANVPDRIFAVSDDVSAQKCVGMFYFDTKANRLMSKFSTPKLS